MHDIDMVVLMNSHNEIIENKNMLNNKIILDTKNSIKQEGIYKL